MLFFQIVAAWFAADLLTGAVHWFEDRYLDHGTLNFLASVAEENDLHHRKPTAMILSTGWTNMKSAAAVGWPLAFALWWHGAAPFVWLVPFFASFGNLVHRFAHMPRKQVPRWIRGLQEFGIFISFEHHDLHHRSMKQLIPKHLAGYKFCPMTDWVNPIVDRIGLWHAIEHALSRLGLRTTKQKLLDSPKSDG